MNPTERKINIRQPQKDNQLVGKVISLMLFPLLLAGRKKMILDEDKLFELYVVQQMTCDDIKKILKCSEDKVHRTLREMGVKLGLEILRDRNSPVYLSKRGGKPKMQR